MLAKLKKQTPTVHDDGKGVKSIAVKKQPNVTSSSSIGAAPSKDKGASNESGDGSPKKRPRFIRSPKFSGAKEGYSFKKGVRYVMFLLNRICGCRLLRKCTTTQPLELRGKW